MPAAQFEAVLETLKAVAHESRLQILGVLAARECNVEELARMLGLKPPTISHHLSTLAGAGLVAMRPEGNSHFYRLDVAGLTSLRKQTGSRARVAALVDGEDLPAGDRRVLRSFLDGEQIRDIPASRAKRQVLLRWLVEKVERGRRYPERELNRILLRHHWDSATLRREMVASGLLARTRAGVYWRPD